VTVSPKHPLSLGSVYEPPRPGATDRRPRFHTPRGLSAEIGKDPRFATSATGRLAGHPGVVSDLSADLLCRSMKEGLVSSPPPVMCHPPDNILW
jgi:hypothetical protein